MGFNTDILIDENVSAYGKLVYFALSKYVNKNGECWPSLLKLQGLCVLSKPTVIKAIKELSNAGHVKIEHRFNNGMKTSSQYYLKNLDKSDVSDIDNDVSEINNVNKDKANKSRCKRDLPRGKRGLLTDVNDIDINLSINNLSNNINSNEQKILNYLPTINGYTFDEKKDLAQVKEWLNKYPPEHVLGELEKFNAWWRDRESSFKGKKNFRSSITNWLKKADQDKQATKPKRKFLLDE